jgi:riboflavin biosynthesis pyrimidine reductase
MTRSPLPTVACLATSLDGKLTLPPHADKGWTKLGTPADLNRLFEARNHAQALVMGAATVRAWPQVRWSLAQRQAQQAGALWQTQTPLHHVVLTRDWELTGKEAVLQRWQAYWPPLVIASPTPPPAHVLQCWPRVWHWLPLPALGNDPREVGEAQWQAQSYLAPIYECLRGLDVKQVQVEGGGQVVDLFATAGWLDTLLLTLTPWLIGGATTPSLRDGVGAMGLSSAVAGVAWQLQHCHPLGNEVYLTYGRASAPF